VFATKYPIDDIQGKKWPKLNDLCSGEKLGEVSYISKCFAEEKSIHHIEIKEQNVFLRGNYDLDPVIFYRVSEKLKEGIELAPLELTEFYELSPNKGLFIEISPDF